MRTALLVLLLAATPVLAQDTWNPAKTRVFAVGVLNFADKTLGTWPDEGRVDSVMIEALKKRGVPDANIVFLKNGDATRETVEKKLGELLAASAEGETLLFYYAGHGSRDFSNPRRPVSLVCYDSLPDKPASYWLLSDVVRTIETSFRGGTVLLTADCCHSGAFIEELPGLKTSRQWGVLASVQPGSRSTGNWTFTQCLVDAFNGYSPLDSDGDGHVTFKEAGAWAEAEMAFCEDQLSCAWIRGLKDSLVLAKVSDKKAARVGERLEAEDEGKWWKVKVLDAKDGKLLVTWLGWDKQWDRWVEEKQTRPYKPTTFEPETAVEVEWDGVWYAARVLQTRLGLHFVHYDGYPDADREWVPRKRIRLARKAKD
ncbi:MAG: caspase family protein [Planctomycetes bacterium]|jgi:hypothetical protein|nr:caspase family protein [Planctomycetota bacterium]MCL4729611.1 caspase family protein [Planctomycetota bacterium]